MNMSKPCMVKWFNVVAFVIMVVVNALAVLLPINNVTPGQVSDSYPNLFAPAPVTFSIWSVIHLALFAFMLFQFDLSGTGDCGTDSAVGRIGPYFILSSLLNILWIFSWHYGLIWLALVFIALLLWSLAVIILRINRGQLTGKEMILVKIPFSIYFGWITVATIANVTTFLVSIGWNAFSLDPTVWTMVILLIGLAIGVATLYSTDSPFYGLAMAWAYLGIAIRHSGFFAHKYPPLITVAAICSAILLLASLVVFYLDLSGKRRQIPIIRQ